MDAVKKVIQKIRGGFVQPYNPNNAVERFFADIEKSARIEAMMASDISITEENMFRARLPAMLKAEAEAEAEAERQRQIAETRMKNLKKAQRKLRRLRKKGVI